MDQKVHGSNYEEQFLDDYRMYLRTMDDWKRVIGSFQIKS